LTDAQVERDVISLPVKIWGLRALLIGAIVLLCVWAGSPVPSWAVAISWSPNGLFLALFMRGLLRLPRVLEPVHPVEPVLYRWLGVGLVKRIVANEVWPMLHGFRPLPKATNREDFLERIENGMKAAEICHAATFVLTLCVAGYYVADDQGTVAVWITVFNVLLNAYPVMLQRSNRRRLQQGRAATARALTNAA
jgi:hypothetical protein